MRKQIMTAAVAVALTVAQATMAADAPAAPDVSATPAAPAAPVAQSTPDTQTTRVLVAPFVEANDMQRPDWINRAIQQAVIDDLSALSDIEVMPADPASAIPSPAQAKAAGVKYIVRGTIQRLNGQIRVSGRVQNVEDGRTVGGFKATGSQQQLFALEDSIEQQLKRVLAPMEADLENPQPVGVGSRGMGGMGGTNTLPPQPIRGVYEGSDLQRALDDRDYLNRAARRGPTQYNPPPVYEPPTYPAGYGPGYYPPMYPGYGYGGYGYGGWGWGWGGGTNVIIVKPGHGHGGNGGGGVSGPSLPQIQTQRIRDAAVFGGANSNVVSPLPPRAPAPGTKRP